MQQLPRPTPLFFFVFWPSLGSDRLCLASALFPHERNAMQMAGGSFLYYFLLRHLSSKNGSTVEGICVPGPAINLFGQAQ